MAKAADHCRRHGCLHESLAPDLQEFVIRQAQAMGLPSADDFLLLLVKLAKQHEDLAGIDERYRAVFPQKHGASSRKPSEMVRVSETACGMMRRGSTRAIRCLP
jgi:hypothetical protein